MRFGEDDFEDLAEKKEQQTAARNEAYILVAIQCGRTSLNADSRGLRHLSA